MWQLTQPASITGLSASQRGMQMLAEKELLPEVKKVHLEKCIDCLAGKQNRVAFRSRPPMRRKNALELMHTMYAM